MITHTWSYISTLTSEAARFVDCGLLAPSLLPSLAAYEEYLGQWEAEIPFLRETQMHRVLSMIADSIDPVHDRVRMELARISATATATATTTTTATTATTTTQVQVYPRPYGLVQVYLGEPESLVASLSEAGLTFEALNELLQCIPSHGYLQEVLAWLEEAVVDKVRRDGALAEDVGMFQAVKRRRLPLVAHEEMHRDVLRLVLSVETMLDEFDGEVDEWHFRIVRRAGDIKENSDLSYRDTLVCERLVAFLIDRWVNPDAPDERSADEIFTDIVDDVHGERLRSFVRDVKTLAYGKSDYRTISSLLTWYSGDLYSKSSVLAFRNAALDLFPVLKTH